MAKYTTEITTSDPKGYVKRLANAVVYGSVTAEIEDVYYEELPDGFLNHIVFERYSAIGKNRVSMSMVALAQGNKVKISGITSGGSQAVFLKVNTFGENAFLDTLRSAVATTKR